MGRLRVSGLIFSLLVAAVAGLGPGPASAHRSAASLAVFKNAHLGYAISYPASWKKSASSQLDVLVTSPDTFATIGGKGIQGGLGTADLRKAVDSTIDGLGSSATAINHTTEVIHHVTFQVGDTTRTIGGISERAIVLAASVHQRTYLFFGIVVLGKPAAHIKAPNAKQELTQVQASFARITIAS
jgi:hypothetical protein